MPSHDLKTHHSETIPQSPPWPTLDGSGHSARGRHKRSLIHPQTRNVHRTLNLLNKLHVRDLKLGFNTFVTMGNLDNPKDTYLPSREQRRP